MDRVVESQVHSGSADYLKAITIALFLVMGHVYDAANIRWKLHGRDEVMRDEIIPRLKNALASAGVADLEVEIWDNAGKNWGLLL